MAKNPLNFLGIMIIYHKKNLTKITTAFFPHCVVNTIGNGEDCDQHENEHLPQQGSSSWAPVSAGSQAHSSQVL